MWCKIVLLLISIAAATSEKLSVPEPVYYPGLNPQFQAQKREDTGITLSSDAPKTWSELIANTLLPIGSTALDYGIKGLVYASQIFALLSVGFIFTVLVCHFTPFCTMSINVFGLKKQEMKEKVKEATNIYATAQDLNNASQKITEAIDKIQAENK